MYYRYWMDQDDHCVAAHYGIRTHRYKLICYYAPGRYYNGEYPEGTEETTWPQWELFDLQNDKYELKNVYDDPDYADVVKELKNELARLRKELKDDKDERHELSQYYILIKILQIEEGCYRSLPLYKSSFLFIIYIVYFL